MNKMMTFFIWWNIMDAVFDICHVESLGESLGIFIMFLLSFYWGILIRLLWFYYQLLVVLLTFSNNFFIWEDNLSDSSWLWEFFSLSWDSQILKFWWSHFSWDRHDKKFRPNWWWYSLMSFSWDSFFEDNCMIKFNVFFFLYFSKYLIIITAFVI